MLGLLADRAESAVKYRSLLRIKSSDIDVLAPDNTKRLDFAEIRASLA